MRRFVATTAASAATATRALIPLCQRCQCSALKSRARRLTLLTFAVLASLYVGDGSSHSVYSGSLPSRSLQLDPICTAPAYTLQCGVGGAATRGDSVSAAAAPSASPLPAPFLLVSVTWAETDERFFSLWCNATAGALAALPYAIYVSVLTPAAAAALGAAAASSAAAGRVHFSRPFLRLPYSSGLLGAHVANLRAALAAGVPFSHATLTASNALFFRHMTAQSFPVYINQVAPASAFYSVGTSSSVGWFFHGVIVRDATVWAWRARLSAAVHESCTDYNGTCAPGPSCAPEACSLSRVSTYEGGFEGFTATHRAWVNVLLPAVEDFLHGCGAARDDYGGVAPADPPRHFWPVEEVVLATAAAVGRAACGGDFVTKNAGFIAWDGDEVAQTIKQKSLDYLLARGEGRPLIAKRFKRDADDPIVNFIADISRTPASELGGGGG